MPTFIRNETNRGLGHAGPIEKGHLDIVSTEQNLLVVKNNYPGRPAIVDAKADGHDFVFDVPSDKLGELFDYIFLRRKGGRCSGFVTFDTIEKNDENSTTGHATGRETAGHFAPPSRQVSDASMTGSQSGGPHGHQMMHGPQDTQMMYGPQGPQMMQMPMTGPFHTPYPLPYYNPAPPYGLGPVMWHRQEVQLEPSASSQDAAGPSKERVEAPARSPVPESTNPKPDSAKDNLPADPQMPAETPSGLPSRDITRSKPDTTNNVARPAAKEDRQKDTLSRGRPGRARGPPKPQEVKANEPKVDKDGFQLVTSRRGNTQSQPEAESSKTGRAKADKPKADKPKADKPKADKLKADDLDYKARTDIAWKKSPSPATLAECPFDVKGLRYGDENSFCGSCGAMGHVLVDCVKYGHYGWMGGCPYCNSNKHNFDDCEYMDFKNKALLVYILVVRRANKCPIRTKKS
ncbi:Putative Zinc finger, CCHC-type superfamily [Colletotrichum destructivum]|uniref:Zinc finger, CCHC-type superfamily n=1 Tax=Colletotrichum destructivum TaxID=34406 RepID=A0AAX4HYR1_9PEZI|nr:Putative Zinc finger, CCHC-type superfamily [Colletotrichum destructivum]